MAGTDDENGVDAEPATDADVRPDEGLPWYVKAVIVLVLLIVAFVLVIDLFELAGAV